mgnify:CR=1 FL=1
MAVERKLTPTHEAPYRGLKVLDFGQGIASPYCAMLLGVYGADVIKVEPPEGDWSRYLGTTYGNHTTLSAVYNRGKRSLCLDMKNKDGIAVAQRLAREADVLAAMRDAGLTYVEEPLPVRDLRARAALHAAGVLPIVADDSCFTPADLERELDFDTFDVLNVKTARNGFTDGRAMLRAAAAHGKRGMVGSQASTGLGTLHAALLATQAEVTEPCELGMVLKLKDDLLSEPISFRDGWLDVRELRDHTLNPAQLERYLL